jgi:peptide/nickel transport system ATP-binding protein
LSGTPETEPRSPVLAVTALSKRFEGFGGVVDALSQVSFTLHRGEALAIVGASGSGKSTIARIVSRLLTADTGEIRWKGEVISGSMSRSRLRTYRREVQMVFQDPFASLNPVHTVGHHLERPLLRHRVVGREGVQDRVHRLLETVGLVPAGDFASRYPHALSGGQLQRVAIARALAVGPELLILDEPTSMLDVSLRLGILRLLDELQASAGMAYLYITHDLASARYLADRVLVMCDGRVVEEGAVEAVLRSPREPYARRLLGAVPRGDGSLLDGHREGGEYAPVS